jgi:hypothetical protein
MAGGKIIGFRVLLDKYNSIRLPVARLCFEIISPTQGYIGESVK